MTDRDKFIPFGFQYYRSPTHSASVIDYVNPLQGADSVYTFSNGNTLPLVSIPNGMAAWSAQTDEAGAGWFFHPSHRHFQGIRLTHQPSPWIRDYGHLTFMPQTGSLALSASMRASSFRPAETVYAPDYFRVQLARYQTTLELAPTARGAMLRMTFDNTETARLVVSPFDGESYARIDCNGRRLYIYTRAHFGELPGNFATYVVVEFDCEIEAKECGLFDATFEPQHTLEGTGERLGAYVGFNAASAASAQGVVTARIGTSFIGFDQAARNLERESGGRSFGQIRTAAREAWESRLGSIGIEGGTEGELRTFYSCLYRVCLFPRMLHEYDGENRQVHYSPFDGQVHNGPMYGDFGFWDLYRTSLPLYSLLYPSLLAEMAAGWVNVWKESGWMPKWLSPGERSAMPGTLVDAAFADMIVKGIDQFDVASAYAGLKKHAMEAGDGGTGRKGLGAYKRLGYLPQERFHESVSNTLDYQYGDFCIARIALRLGCEEDYRYFMSRADGYRNLFDADSAFMRGLDEGGCRHEPFDPLEWGGPYCEGGAWQCSWAVPHDVAGLADLMGGREAFKTKLDELMTMRPLFRTGTYGVEIHEMSEMAAADFGQFALSNQPSFHIPYLYAAIGYPASTQYWTRRAMEQLFSDRSDGFPGDEDNGSLGAWYVWNALGLYPLCPGTDEYVLGSPLFSRVSIALESKETLTIEARQGGPGKPYWSNCEVNGKPWEKLFVKHGMLAAGGTLVLKMSDQPAVRAYADEQLPYSMSRSV